MKSAVLHLTLGTLGASYFPVNAASSGDVHTAFPAAFSCFEYNADYSGRELTRFPATTAEACHERCGQTTDCSFFNHHALSSICVLRTGLLYTGSRQRKNVVSGPKHCLACAEEGTAYGGERIESATANSATHCQSLCAANEDCQFFTFDTIMRTCDLLKDSSAQSTAANKLSGPKICTSQQADLGPAPPCAVHRVKYGTKPLFTAAAEDAIACQGLCQNSSSCEAFAFNTSSSECHLHLANSERKKQEDPVFISGPRECSPSCLREGSDYATKDHLENVATGISVPEECQLRCQATTGCTAWSYASDSGACDLLKNGSGSQAVEGVVSGPKFCAGSCDIIGFHSPANSFDWNTLKTGKSLEECRADCQADSKCGVFTWWSDKRCYMKAATCLRNQEPQTGTVRTGWGTCSTCFRQGVGYKTDDFLWQLEAQNAEECRQRCAFLENCTRFTYDAAAKQCFMLSGETGDIEGEHLQSGPANCSADNSCHLANIQWQHNDNIVRTYNDPATPEACQALCASNVRCRFFTFFLPSKECNLKTGVNGTPILTLPLNSWVSGPKKCVTLIDGCDETNFDYSQSDIYKTPDMVGDMNKCRKACYNEPQCRVFTYNRTEGRCWKKTIGGFSKRSSHSSATSGSRFGCPQCLRAWIEYTGPIIKEATYPGLMPCQLACEQDAKCKFFTFKGTKCKLMESQGVVKAADRSTISGPKQC